jgi:hypothetical protein
MVVSDTASCENKTNASGWLENTMAANTAEENTPVSTQQQTLAKRVSSSG